MSDTAPTCRCCGKPVIVMAELNGRRSRVYCGSLCRRGLCGHVGPYTQLVREAHPPTERLRELYRGAAG